jgi:hypothetical protein
MRGFFIGGDSWKWDEHRDPRAMAGLGVNLQPALYGANPLAHVDQS